MTRPDRRRFPRTGFVGGALVLVGQLLNLVSIWTETRWLVLAAIVLWLVGVVLVLIAATRYVSGRNRSRSDPPVTTPAPARSDRRPRALEPSPPGPP